MPVAAQQQLAQWLLENAGLHELCTRLDEPAMRLPLATQRHLAILRLAATGPRLLCIDEPTTGLNLVDAQRLLAYISRESERRAMLVVLHNQQHADIVKDNPGQ